MLISGTKQSIPSVDAQVQIKYSPVIELPASLHCLATQGSGDTLPETLLPCNQWIHDNCYVEFVRLGQLTADWSLVMDLFVYIEQHDIDDVISSMSKLPKLNTTDLVYGLFSGLVSRSAIEQAIMTGITEELERQAHSARLFEVISRDSVIELVSDADSIKRDLSSFLKAYWHDCFSKVWNAIGTQEIELLREQRSLLTSQGTTSYLIGCHNGIYVTNQSISLIRRDQRSYELISLSSIDVILSAFIGRELMCNRFGSCLTIYRGVNVSPSTVPNIPDEVVGFLKATANKQRLQILGSLKESPKTTKELSDIFKIAPSSVSVHLKVLREAELVYPQRISDGVIYRFLYENYKAQASYMSRLLDTAYIHTIE